VRDKDSGAPLVLATKKNVTHLKVQRDTKLMETEPIDPTSFVQQIEAFVRPDLRASRPGSDF